MSFKVWLQNKKEIKKKKNDLIMVEESIRLLNNMLVDAKRDLGDLTIEDVVSQVNNGEITKEAGLETINAIECLQLTICNTPEMIKNSEETRDKILKEINELLLK